MKKNAKRVPTRTQTSRPSRRAFPTRVFLRGDFYRARATQSGTAQSLQVDKDELADRLRHFSIFASVSRDVLTVLAARARLCTFGQGDFLWRRGDLAKEVVLINSGFVKVSRRNRNGDSKTYGLFGPGDSMGLYAFWAGMRYPTDAVALSAGVVLITINAGEISDLAERSPRLSGNLKGEVTRFSEAFINKIEIVSAGSIEQRIAVLSLHLVERYGVDKRGEQARLPVFLTLVQISELVDARFETVARCLGKWKRSGWLIIEDDGWHFCRLDNLRELLHG